MINYQLLWMLLCFDLTYQIRYPIFYMSDLQRRDTKVLINLLLMFSIIHSTIYTPIMYV